jgi:hypothetical protein
MIGNIATRRHDNPDPHEGLFGRFGVIEPPTKPAMPRARLVQPDDPSIARGFLPSDDWIVNEAGRWLAHARMSFKQFTVEHLPSPYRDQPDYLASDHWRRFRRKRIRLAGEQCECCSLSRTRCRQRYAQDLNVHHLDSGYERLGAERDEDVLVLCPRCHLAAECGKIGHPAFIDVDGKGVRCCCGELNAA